MLWNRIQYFSNNEYGRLNLFNLLNQLNDEYIFLKYNYYSKFLCDSEKKLFSNKYNKLNVQKKLVEF
jgi:hypothetical protein